MTDATFKFFAAACFGLGLLFAVTACADRVAEPDSQDWRKPLCLSVMLTALSIICVVTMFIQRRICPDGDDEEQVLLINSRLVSF